VADAPQYTYSSDEEGDYEPASPPKTPSLGTGTAAKKKSKLPTRKFAVSAESISEAFLKKSENIPNIPKSPEVTAMLRKVVSKSPLLRILDAELKDKIVWAFRGPVIVSVDTDVIIQGDIGDAFYLLEEGSLEVSIKKNKTEVKVHTYKSGDAFGQLALLYNAPRAATCRAKVESKLWILDRSTLRMIVSGFSAIKRDSYAAALLQVPLFRNLNETELHSLADSLLEEKFEDGAIVCSEKAPMNRFYLVKDGNAICSVRENNAALGGSSDKDAVVVSSLAVGSFWGEASLVDSNKVAPIYKFTVKASGVLRILSMDKDRLTRVLGSLDDILLRVDFS
jgi:cAMP-dependent protein kinase regulator